MREFTGYYDAKGKKIIGGQRVKHLENGEIYEVIKNDFSSKWVIDSEIGQGDIFKHHNKVVVIEN